MAKATVLATLNNAALQPRLQAELIVADGLCPKIAELLPDALHELVALGHSTNPLAAITDELANRRLQGRPVDTLHIVAHGRPGAFQIGRQSINSSTLIANAQLLAQWQVGTIALWSCEVGADHNFVALLEELTGAQVWASASRLGRIDKGGQWQLQRDSELQKQGADDPSLLAAFNPEALMAWPQQLTSTVYNANNGQLVFNSKTYIIGDGKSNGNTVRFNSVITIGGQAIDAVVTTTLAGATVSTYDGTSAGGTTTTAFFGPDLSVTEPTNVGDLNGVKFTIQFYKGGTYTGVGTGSPVTLQNFVINSYDIDSGGGSTSQRQFQAFKGFARYELATNSELATTVQSDGSVLFVYDPSGNPVNNTTYTADGYRVKVYYDQIQSFELLTGATKAATGSWGESALFALDFSVGPAWSGPTTVMGTPAPSLVYSSSTFTEAAANNGSIGNSIVITLSNGTFIGADGQALSGVTLANVPAGLTATVTRVDAIRATLALKGTATSHTNSDDINDLIVTFGNGAFTNGDGSAVTGAVKSDLIVDFNDPAAVLPAISVTSPTVNEASPYAVFSVGVTSDQNLSLALANGSATGGTTTPTNGSLDYGSNALQHSLDNGQTWTDYTAAFNATLTGGATALLVRTSIVNDTVPDNNETFTLSVTPTGGTAVTGTATIKDDGTGDIYKSDGTTDPNAVKNDDRPLTVTAYGPVNEASTYAMFTVIAVAGQGLSLGLENTPTTLDNDATTTAFTMQWSVDGITWTSGGTVPSVPASGTVFVRISITSESDVPFEGAETFALSANYITGGTHKASGIATIVDDGTGSLYSGELTNGQPNVQPDPLNDDRSILSIPDVSVNEQSSHVVFRVSASGGQAFTLALSDGGTGYSEPNDTGAIDNQKAVVNYDYRNQIEIYNGRSWDLYQPGSSILVPTGGSVLLARVPLINDTQYEGAHAYTLTATPTSGNAASGRAIIGDFGTGPIFNDSGAEDRNAPKNDDRVLKVDSPIVNEGSQNVVFNVTGITGPVKLSLQDINGGTGFTTLSNPNLQYWNGTAWLAYPTETFLTPGTNFPAGTELAVRVAIAEEQDTIREGSERFTLHVIGTGGPSVGIATINDDGTGAIWLNNSQIPATDSELTTAQIRRDDDFDLDGITPTTEDALATLAASQGIAGAPGDLNGDGKADAQQNALATLAWKDEPSFIAGNNGTLTDVRPVISLKVMDAASGNTVSGNLQLENIRVASFKDATEFGTSINDVTVDTTSSLRTVTLASGLKVETTYDPIRFVLTPLAGNPNLVDLYPRAGVQVRLSIDMRAANLDASQFNGYIKHVSDAAIAAAGAQGLRDLDGNLITKSGWYDFTRRTPDGDGAKFIVNNGKIDSVELIITDQAFGDNDLQINQILDPGVIVNSSQPLAISSISVNEGSPYAVFQVTGTNNQVVQSLALNSGTATNGVDFGTNLEFFDPLTGGGSWRTYTPGLTPSLDSNGILSVRTSLVNDRNYEGAETFTLSATNISGIQTNGLATIFDDGTGIIFNNDGSINNTAIKDDDRPIPAATAPLLQSVLCLEKQFAPFTQGDFVSWLTAGTASGDSVRNALAMLGF